MRSQFPFDAKLFRRLTLSFILFTIIGTLSHEAGHLLTAKLLGYKDGKIHYGSTSTGHTVVNDSLDYFYKKFRYQLKNKFSFPERSQIASLERRSRPSRAYVIWGGPLQTMLTGTIGLLAVWVINRKRPDKRLPLSLAQWFWALVALFWLRQLANFATMLGLILFSGRYGRGDEPFLSTYYNLPIWSLNAITAGLSLLVLYYVLFRFIPQHQRFTFVTAGLIGGVSGYVLWLILLGPILLP